MARDWPAEPVGIRILFGTSWMSGRPPARRAEALGPKPREPVMSFPKAEGGGNPPSPPGGGLSRFAGWPGGYRPGGPLPAFATGGRPLLSVDCDHLEASLSKITAADYGNLGPCLSESLFASASGSLMEPFFSRSARAPE